MPNEAANGLYRSQDMTYISITMPGEGAAASIHAIGKMGKFHTVDLASKEHPSKEYTQYKKHVVDCIFWEKKLTALATLMDKFNVVLPNASIEEMKAVRVLESIDDYLGPVEQEISRHESFLEQNARDISMVEEQIKVLEAAKQFAGAPHDDDSLRAEDFAMREMKEGKEVKGNEFSFRKTITGTLPSAKKEFFRRMLYRITRGTAASRFIDIPEPVLDAAGGTVLKSVFSVLLLGGEAEQRIHKMCAAFGATIFEIPDDINEVSIQLQNQKKELKLKEELKEKTEQAVRRVLTNVAFDEKKSISPIRSWYHLIQIEKAVARKFMRCHFYQSTVVMEGWVPTKYLEDLRQSLKDAVKGSGEPPAALEESPAHPIGVVGSPPTYFETNKFTQIFQGIVDTYGVPRYKEVNPGLFTIITFPFLFGVMYGDIGHGTILVLYSVFVLLNEKKTLQAQQEGRLGEIHDMIFSGRYIILFMALFATYCGFIYNDCFSVPLHLATSHWEQSPDNNETLRFTGHGVYPFGIDPSWYHKANELIFFNSVKMKLAVTLGVIQMTFGVMLSLSNHIYFKDYISIFFEFLPRLLFLLCTFGYMIAIIIYKATIDWTTQTIQPPSLIQTMIKMFLSPGKVTDDVLLYNGQAGLQLAFLIIAVLSVPTMLCVKPCWNRHKFRPHANKGHHEMKQDEDEEMGPEEKEHKKNKPVTGHGGTHGHGDEEYDFSDDFIHTAIHTIEYVLGTVSNTASYLRLWALSLAHAELANVFWSKILVDYGLDTGNPVMVFITWAVWAAATFGVLLAMDVLECFLHALRLHWVEFQNKFYYADGYPFKPFTLDEKDSDE